MCEWGTWEIVHVKIPADLSCTGSARWKDVNIDSCIAGLVRGLQRGGIDMRGSCCGHDDMDFGTIHLQDGRMLVITDAKLYYQELRWICVALKYFLQRQIRYVINRWRWRFDFS